MIMTYFVFLTYYLFHFVFFQNVCKMSISFTFHGLISHSYIAISKGTLQGTLGLMELIWASLVFLSFLVYKLGEKRWWYSGNLLRLYAHRRPPTARPLSTVASRRPAHGARCAAVFDGRNILFWIGISFWIHLLQYICHNEMNSLNQEAFTTSLTFILTSRQRINRSPTTAMGFNLIVNWHLILHTFMVSENSVHL